MLSRSRLCGPLALLHAGALLAQPIAQPLDVPRLLFEQHHFHERLAESRWVANAMEYVDGVSSAVLRHPYTVAFDPADGSMFVASFTLNHVVRLQLDRRKRRAKYKVWLSGAELDSPVGLAVWGGSLFVGSFTMDHIVRVDLESGELLYTFGNEEQLDCPEGIAIGPGAGDVAAGGGAAATLYVASFLRRDIARYDAESGEYLGSFAPQGGAEKPGPQLLGAEDLAFDWNGDLHVTSYHSDQVIKYNGSSGAAVHSYGRGLLRGPVGISCGPQDGDMYVSSYKANQVLRFTAEGQFVGVAAGANPLVEAAAAGRRREAVHSPSGLAFDPHDGTMHVLSYVSGSIVRFNGSSAAARRTWRITE